MKNKLLTLLALCLNLSWRWIFFRIFYAAKKHTGLLRIKMPKKLFSSLSFERFLKNPILAEPSAYFAFRSTNSKLFFFSHLQQKFYQLKFAKWDADTQSPIHLGNQITHGKFKYFYRDIVNAGYPPDWHTNLFDNITVPNDIHWSSINDFDHGDIKLVWELNRFHFTYTLVRAYWRNRDEKYVQTFWDLVESWKDMNPINCGANWKCGQEIAFRVMAWCFGLYGFINATLTKEEHVAELVKLIAVSGERIRANLSYSISQQNNHGISEAVALFTIGILFPELKMASSWQRTGHDLLESQAMDLITDDGEFSQLSSNYHRLILDLFTWAIALGRLNNINFSFDMLERLRKALLWSYQLMEIQTGRMPNSGGNDGTLLLPLTNCNYSDHRPTLQAASYILNGKLLFTSGPWDELGLWLFGPDFLCADREKRNPSDSCTSSSSFKVLRNRESWAVLRCGPFHHRPSHADLLHLDLWWRGQNIALDPGTYSYNPDKSWDAGLAGTAYHNTVTLDDLDQMSRISRFIWLPWADSIMVAAKRSAKGYLAWMEGVHLGYQKPCFGTIHRRSVISIAKEWWVVLDSLEQGYWQTSRLHWLFKDAPYQWKPKSAELFIDYPQGKFQVKIGPILTEQNIELVRADHNSPRGWLSTHYHCKNPALSVSIKSSATLKYYYTIMGPSGFTFENFDEGFLLKTEGFNAQMKLEHKHLPNCPSSGLLILKGSLCDSLYLT